MEEVGTQYSVLSTQFSVLSEKARPGGNGCDRFFSRVGGPLRRGAGAGLNCGFRAKHWSGTSQRKKAQHFAGLFSFAAI